MVKVVWVVLRGGRHGDVRSLTQHGGGVQVTGSSTHLENSHTLRISKKREPVLSVSLSRYSRIILLPLSSTINSNDLKE